MVFFVIIELIIIALITLLIIYYLSYKIKGNFIRKGERV